MASLVGYAALADSRAAPNVVPTSPAPVVDLSVPQAQKESKAFAIAVLIASLVMLVLGWSLVTGVIPTTLPIRIFAAIVVSGASFGMGVGFHLATNKV